VRLRAAAERQDRELQQAPGRVHDGLRVVQQIVSVRRQPEFAVLRSMSSVCSSSSSVLIRSKMAAGVACMARAVARTLRNWARVIRVSRKRVFVA
jgi:hypothetical protein